MALAFGASEWIKHSLVGNPLPTKTPGRGVASGRATSALPKAPFATERVPDLLASACTTGMKMPYTEYGDNPAQRVA